MTDDETMRRCRRVLAEKSQSFDSAAPFLPPDRHDDAAVVYAFCRMVDDTVDEGGHDGDVGRRLEGLHRQLDGKHQPEPVVEAFIDVADRRDIELASAHELIEGVASDLGDVRMQNDRELLRYCYRVAGTVGLMMTPLLGVDDARAEPYAIDLGIGMQLTNICRDVAEDAADGRVYLPAERLRAAGFEPGELLDGTFPRGAVAGVVADLLDLAEDYYESAHAGFRFIPARSRFAILFAANRYRRIGTVLQRQGCDPFGSDTTVGGMEAFRTHVGSLMVFFATLLPLARSSETDRAGLHRYLESLPGTRTTPSNPGLR